MSETLVRTAIPTATPMAGAAAVQAPTVYFIDDSATMREVIKIAFRKENIHVVACHDAASAIAQMEQTSPDVVISDVIMPDKDGYEVCQHIKKHPQLAHTPVILMSGVVNRTVADKALAVKADELIRKPFQPQELIARVKQLLKAQGASTAPAQTVAPTPPAAPANTTRAWSNLFAVNPVPEIRPGASTGEVSGSNATAAPTSPAGTAAPSAPVLPSIKIAPPIFAPRSTPAIPAREVVADISEPPTLPRAGAPSSLATQKLHVEVQRLEQLVKKLRSELEAERDYCRSLEESVKALQEATE
jgi:CheY-like chemotaxis protein